MMSLLPFCIIFWIFGNHQAWSWLVHDSYMPLQKTIYTVTQRSMIFYVW